MACLEIFVTYCLRKLTEKTTIHMSYETQALNLYPNSCALKTFFVFYITLTTDVDVNVSPIDNYKSQ